MSTHDYTPEQAVEVLLSKIGQRDSSLELAVRVAIDAGKDVSETIGTRGTRGTSGTRRRPRPYRKTVPFTHEEAVEVALNALRAYFVEIPQCINSAMDNFRAAAVGIPIQQPESIRWDARSSEPVGKELVGDEKVVEIELQTVTQISRARQDTFPLKLVEPQQVNVQLNNIKRLMELVNFREDQNSGDAH